MGYLQNDSTTTITVLVSGKYYDLPPGTAMGALIGSSDADVDGYWLNGSFYAVSGKPWIGPIDVTIATNQVPDGIAGTWEGNLGSEDSPINRGAPNNAAPVTICSITCPVWTDRCFPESAFRSNPTNPHSWSTENS